MEKEFNVNVIAADFLDKRYKDFLKITSGVVKKGSDQINLALKSKYRKYIETIATRYCKSKSFMIREEPVPLRDFYIPLGVENRKFKLKSAQLEALLTHSRYCILQGSAGAGKSILMKYLLLNCLEDSSKVPVFIELRDIDSVEDDLCDTISSVLEDFNLKLDREYFIKSLEHGHYVIFLDGLDEVKAEVRNKLIKDIEVFTKKYDKCDIILSTRPDDRISGLALFKSFTIVPLDLEKCIALINKIPDSVVDNVMRDKFIGDLEADLFAKHQSFLSNPLLLQIMLLTYQYSADIPNKLSIFYDQAYEALFQRHDALKGAYKRIRETTLDILEFEKVINCFCIQLYDERKIKFSKLEALRYLEKAKMLSNIEFDTNAFLNDLLQSVCILVEEGVSIAFAHRSFQEYFAACFIVKSPAEVKVKLLNKYALNVERDNLFKLVHEMDTEFMEFKVWLPYLEDFFKLIDYKGEMTKEIYLKFIQKRWDRFSYDGKSTFATVKDPEFAKLNYHILRNFDKFKEFTKQLNKKSSTELFKLFTNKAGLHLFFETRDMTLSHPVFQELYSGDTFFSPIPLKMLYEIYQALQAKLASLNSTLDTLLLSKKA